MYAQNLQVGISKVESQLSTINLNLETALHRRNGRKTCNDIRSYRRRSSSQPAARSRVSPDHVHIIPINFEDNESKIFSKSVTPQSSVSRIMISSQTQSILKPTVPEKPKNIQLIKKKLEDIKSANVYPSSEIALRNSVLRKSNKLKNNPFRRFSEEVSTHDLVSDVQFEILKLLSEKDDLQRENEVLKHYRQSYIELMAENNQLKEKLELMELSRARKNIFKSKTIDLKPRTEPDGQEDRSCDI